MELKRAKEVLEGMDLYDFTSVCLLSKSGRAKPYVNAVIGEGVEIADAFDNPDQLEAIATWMRDPEGVVKA